VETGDNNMKMTIPYQHSDWQKQIICQFSSSRSLTVTSFQWQLSVFIVTGRPVRSAAMPVLFLLSGPTWVSAETLPDKREIWHGVRSPVPNITFIWAEMWKYSHQNCQNFEFWP